MRETIQNLQALRGVACILVVLYHTADAEHGFGLGFAPLAWLRWFGYAGVDLFFVLSGFIIASTTANQLGQAQALPGYLFRRFWRIYPLYWLVLGFAVLYAACFGGDLLQSVTTAEALNHLLLLPTTDGNAPRLLPIAWTLSFEVLFYLVFALRFLLPIRLGWLSLATWGTAVLAAAGAGWVPENRFSRLILSPFVLEFLFGVMLTRWPLPLNLRWALGGIIVALIMMATGLLIGRHADPGGLATDIPRRVLIFGPGMALLVGSVVALERWGARCQRRWLLAAGDASYSIYLFHNLAILLVLSASMAVGWGHSRVPHLIWIATTVGAALKAGMFLHRWAEKPLLDWGKRWIRARRRDLPGDCDRLKCQVGRASETMSMSRAA